MAKGITEVSIGGTMKVACTMTQGTGVIVAAIDTWRTEEEEETSLTRQRNARYSTPCFMPLQPVVDLAS